MIRRILLSLAVVVFAFGVLFTSVLRSASVKYTFTSETADGVTPAVLGEENVEIDYQLPYPGRIHPDSPLWPLKALRDRIWFWLTTNPSRRAELKLLFADKRLGSAKILFERGKYDVGFTTFTKAEKYLEEARILEKENRENGIDTTEFLKTIANAALKHFQVSEELYDMAPEDAKPDILKTQNYAKSTFERTRNALLEEGLTAPENPFDFD